MAQTGKAQRPAEQDATSTAPVAVFRYGNISAAIFPAEVKTKDGGSVTLMNVSLQRSYRTEDGEWHRSHSLRKGDLLPAAYALEKCYDFIVSGAQSTSDE